MYNEIISSPTSYDNNYYQFFFRDTLQYLLGYITKMPDGVCHARQKIIAKKLGISERQVRTHITRLVDLGVLTIEKVKMHAGMLRNSYRTNFARIKELNQLKQQLQDETYPQKEPDLGKTSYMTSGIYIYKENRSKNKPIHTSCPQELVPTDPQLQMCVENGLNWLDVLSGFKEHNKGKGNLFQNWGNALTGWILNAIKFKKLKSYGQKKTGSYTKPGGDMAKPLPIRETFIPLPDDFKKSDRRSALIYQIDMAKALGNGKKVIQLQKMLDELNSIHKNENEAIGEVFI